MTVGIELGSIIDEVGTGDFFHAFFSTISGNLEPKGWGSRFPVLMNKLYPGEATQPDAAEALAELGQASAELAKLPVSKVIWDVEDRSKAPPGAILSPRPSPTCPTISSPRLGVT